MKIKNILCGIAFVLMAAACNDETFYVEAPKITTSTASIVLEGSDAGEAVFTFTANLPANLQEQAQIVSQLDGMISRKTLLSLLPFVTDPKEEMEELDKEREDEGAGDYAELGGEPGGEE